MTEGNMPEVGDEQEEEAEEPRFPPPTQEQVAYRALCLYAMTVRGFCEQVVRTDLEVGIEAGPHDLRGRLERTYRWLEEGGAEPHFGARERELLAKPLASWDDQDIIDAGWRAEAVGVLFWALSLLDALPPYVEQFEEGAELLRRAGWSWLGSIDGLLARARLRPHEEIAHARDGAELWHWRARTRQVQEDGSWSPEGQPKELNTFEKIIRKAAETAHEEGWSAQPIGHDFPAFGKPYARISDEQYSLAMSIAMERHFALNWLCGYSEDWDNTPTDT